MKLHKITYGVSLSLLVLVVALGLWVGFSSPKGPGALGSHEAWVDDDDPTCGGNSPCFQTIQAAVEAVDDSELSAEVYIRPGRYRENVVIKRIVSLIGVRGLVRLEALDPEKPTILVSNGLESRAIGVIRNLEIIGGKVGIELVNARIKYLIDNRIMGYFASPFTTTAGIWVERSVIEYDIIDNEISGAMVGIFLRKGALVIGRIHSNTIHRTSWGIMLQDDARVDFISANTFNHNGGHIVVTDQARAYIVRNQLLLGQRSGIEVTKSARVIIENNLISSNETGIYISCVLPSLSPSPVPEKDPCPGLPGPLFTLIRNRIMGSLYGIILVVGQGKILRNWISESGDASGSVPFSVTFGDLLLGAGLLLGERAQAEISHNWIVNNTVGAAYGIPLLDQADSDCEWSRENRPFKGKLTGSNNEIKDNEFADLCPSAGFPWPPGFRK